MTAIASNLQAVNRAIAQAAHVAQRRAENITLLAVSKTFPAAAVREAYEAGQRAFGESYVQEALDKIAALRDLPLEWHFIGPIQSNKTRAIAENFAWVHSVSALEIAERLSTLCTQAKFSAMARVLLLCTGPMKCHSIGKSRNTAILSSASCT